MLAEILIQNASVFGEPLNRRTPSACGNFYVETRLISGRLQNPQQLTQGGLDMKGKRYTEEQIIGFLNTSLFTCQP